MVDERAGPRAGALRSTRASRAPAATSSAGSPPTTRCCPARSLGSSRSCAGSPSRCSSTGRRCSSTRTARELFPLDAARVRRGRRCARACANYVVQPGSLFTRRAWELAGPLDEDAHYLFDFEFALARRATRDRQGDPRPARAATASTRSRSRAARSLLKARDYVRFAERFLTGAADGGGRARYLAAGDYFYDARELADARRALVRSLRLRPTRRGAGLLARTLARSVMPCGAHRDRRDLGRARRQGHRARAARNGRGARARSGGTSSSSSRVTRRSCRTRTRSLVSDRPTLAWEQRGLARAVREHGSTRCSPGPSGCRSAGAARGSSSGCSSRRRHRIEREPSRRARVRGSAAAIS